MKLVIFTTCKPFVGDDSWKQEQAIKSWTLLKGIDIKIIVVGDDKGVKEICEKYSLMHEPNVKTFNGVPYLKHMFELAYQHAEEEDYLLWSNSDMIYFNDMIDTILKFHPSRVTNKIKNFLLVGSRYDWHNPKPLKDLSQKNFIKNMNINEENTTNVQQLDSEKYECSLHPKCGIDYMIHSKSSLIDYFDEKLVISGTRHDMILLGIGLTKGYICCDCTETITVIHQNHGYPMPEEDKDRNKLLEKLLLNNKVCKGYQGWIQQCPIYTVYNNKEIDFFMKQKVVNNIINLEL
jgi:hypothetical protein